MKIYDFAVIGGGIAGISIAEILTREGHSVILIDKNDKLSSETTREFHEWLHTGSLYTLIPGQKNVLRFILGAIDDLLEFYSSYERMNITPTNSGLKINESNNKSWFNKNFIDFKYKVKNRKFALPWIYGIARSIYLIEKIHTHDWLRRRAGEFKHFKKGRTKRVFNLFKEILFSNDVFKTVETSDFTINSRLLLRDLLETSIQNGLEISLSNSISDILNYKNYKLIKGSKEIFYAKKVALCDGDGINKFSDVKTKLSYAPIGIVSGLPTKSKSFVELDYFTKNCINLLIKDNGIGLVGGISLSNLNKCDDYLDYVIEKHKTYQPNIKELDRYNGKKTEITFKNADRGYLYHIVNNSENIWSLIPGKFTLAFSMAPEFYRRVFKKNPKKTFKTFLATEKSTKIVSNTYWMDTYLKKNKK